MSMFSFETDRQTETSLTTLYRCQT